PTLSPLSLHDALPISTGAVLAALALAFGFSWQAALVAGFGLAMSSTALVLASLVERKQLATRHGREAFAVLLFQDVSVIPLLARSEEHTSELQSLAYL